MAMGRRSGAVWRVYAVGRGIGGAAAIALFAAVFVSTCLVWGRDGDRVGHGTKVEVGGEVEWTQRTGQPLSKCSNEQYCQVAEHVDCRCSSLVVLGGRHCLSVGTQGLEKTSGDYNELAVVTVSFCLVNSWTIKF